MSESVASSGAASASHATRHSDGKRGVIPPRFCIRLIATAGAGSGWFDSQWPSGSAQTIRRDQQLLDHHELAPVEGGALRRVAEE
jgi:hypothetical protein